MFETLPKIYANFIFSIKKIILVYLLLGKDGRLGEPARSRWLYPAINSFHHVEGLK